LKAVFVPDLAVSITPTDITINLGNSVSFSSSVVGGTTPYSYQWYVGGNPVSGATSSSWMYTPPAVGIYYVQLKVTDFRGRFAMSNTARVVVQSIPVGGYSISQGKPASLPPIAFYTFLLCALGTMISLMRCKRSTRIPLRREVF
ncbi:PKD domain-containing protein, partial [Candidatus Bathyarchaeota archaeon]|nr:PKD domain-containing protein [Candidatus Bathyarchaeota archaeon]